MRYALLTCWSIENENEHGKNDTHSNDLVSFSIVLLCWPLYRD